MSIATTIRQFFHELFGSRVADELRRELESKEALMKGFIGAKEGEILMLRKDYESRLVERDKYVSDLKEEVSILRNKCSQYEMTLIPLVSPVGNFLNPRKKETTDSFSSVEPSSWSSIQADWEKQQQVEAEAEKQRSEAVAAKENTNQPQDEVAYNA